ncbi:hypothetical protein QF037_009668 [Streptomyces canus]|uniref:hypothetical protein n=1 Tax=Streptomyces canus TaxID=58343 RepID=UPI00278142B4|nr:hypothetical protein [Streptomyces canus]
MRILVLEDEVDLAHTPRIGLTAEGYSVALLMTQLSNKWCNWVVGVTDGLSGGLRR